jgi:uncharacterized integral membrane protein (TIGR00698 family)
MAFQDSAQVVLPRPVLAEPAPRSLLSRLAPGLLLSAALAAGAMLLGGLDWARLHGLSALTLAIALGMVVGNVFQRQVTAIGTPGIDFSKQRLLRLGVVLYGLRLTLHDISRVGMAGVAIDALVIASTFLLACWLGTRWLGLERKSAMLIGIGSSICGAAAIMAAEPVVKARAEQVVVAVATVVVFGTLSIFLYPVLFHANLHLGWLGGGDAGFGVYAGSTIHEVAQVVAAARSIGPEAADTAVIAKMVRVLMLAPVLLLLSAWLRRDEARTSGGAASSRGKLAVPWFAVGFVGVVLFNSLQWLPSSAISVANDIDTMILATAMAALGLSTRISAIRAAGAKPLLLAAALFAWLVLGGAAINHGITALFA